MNPEDQTDQSGNGNGASDQPAAPASQPDLEAIVTRVAASLSTSIDKRFQGFQSVMDKKLDAMAREFQTAGLSPEQREQLDAQTTEQELEALRRQVELYQMREQFPKGADLMAKLSEASSLEDQLALIEQTLGGGAAAQVAQTLAEAEGTKTPVPEVDRNNPSRPAEQGLASAMSADEMTDAAADAILNSAGKGALALSRRQRTE